MIDLRGIMDRVQSHALASGWFEAVTGHEPKSRPSVSGITAAHWVQEIAPVARASGLSVTSACVVIMVRLYSSMLQEPQDAIDPNLTDAADALMSAYSAGFTLGGLGTVDLLGIRGGTGLSCRAGYVPIGRGGDSSLMRAYDITLPIILFDTWGQTA